MKRPLPILFFPALGALLLMLFAACHSSHKAESAHVHNERHSMAELNEIAGHQIQYHRFSARAKADYHDDVSDQSFSLQIRMVHDSIIWASITGPLNIEVARVLLTADSLRIMDRLSKKYLIKEFHFISRLANADLSFLELQHIISGQLLDKQSLKSNSTDIDIQGNKAEVEYVSEHKTRNQLTVQLDSQFVNKYTASTLDKSSTLEMELSDYRTISAYPFSFSRKLQFNYGPKKANMELEFTKAELETELEFPFKVDEKYERIR